VGQLAVSLRALSEDVRNTTNSPQPAPPAGTTAGDLLVAIQTADINASLAEMVAPAGWTLVGSGSRPADVGYMKVWRKTATNAEPATYTFVDSTAGQGSTIIAALTGHDATSPVSVTPVFANGAASASHPASSVAITAGDLLLTGHLAGLAGTARTYTAPSGMVGRTSSLSTGPNNLTGVYTLAASTDGNTGARTATCSSATPYLTMSLVITDLATVAPGGSDTVTFRGSSEDARGLATNPVPVPPTGTTAGDLLVAIQTSDLNGSQAAMTAPTGWTEQGSTGRLGTGFMKVWTKVATGSEPASYSFLDETDSQGSTVIVAVTGQDPTAPLVAAPTFNNGTDATGHTAPAVTGATGGLLLTAHLAGTGGTTRSYSASPAGMALVRQSTLSTGANILTAVYQQGLTGTATTDAKTATVSASTPWVTMALVVTPDAAAVAQTVAPDGIPGAAAFGVPTLALPQDVTPVGIPSGAALGTPTVTGIGVAQTVTTIGIGTAAALGVPAVVVVTTSVFVGPYPGATTYPGADQFPGMTNLSPQTVAPFGIFDPDAVGIPDVWVNDPDALTVIAKGIDPVFAVGEPVVTVASVTGLLPDDALYPSVDLYPDGAGEQGVPDLSVAPSGIGTAEQLGFPVVGRANGPQDVVTTAIDPAEAFGVPTVGEILPPTEIQPDSIDPAEAFGRPVVFLEVPPPVTIPGVYFDTYFVDGFDLSNYATQIEVAEGLQDTPGTVGDNIALPGFDGAVQVYGGLGQQRRADAVGRITFSMWLVGVDPDTGTIPDGSGDAEEYLARWDELVRLFHRRTVTIDHPRPDGSVRRAIAHLLPGETMSPSSRSAAPWFGRFKATFAIPGAHWTDLDQVSTGPQSLTSGQALSLAAFSGATAPCTELDIVFGPGNNPRLSTSYSHVGWNGVVAAGRQLGIRTVDGTTNQAGGAAWTPGYDGLTYAPGPRLFEIDPTEALQATLSHTGGGSMTVEVRGKRRYRTS
jgi:hypothetical protein